MFALIRPESEFFFELRSEFDLAFINFNTSIVWHIGIEIYEDSDHRLPICPRIHYSVHIDRRRLSLAHNSKTKCNLSWMNKSCIDCRQTKSATHRNHRKSNWTWHSFFQFEINRRERMKERMCGGSTKKSWLLSKEYCVFGFFSSKYSILVVISFFNQNIIFINN